jgi:hypothetical protein
VARLLVFAIIAILVFAGLRTLLAKQNLTVKQFFSIYLATLLGVGLVFLGVTGRLNPLFALLGVALPFVMRAAGMLARGAQFAAIIKALRGGFGTTQSAPSPQTSEISSRYIHMVLFHETGMMDGTVLEGEFKNAKLSNLELPQLTALLSAITDDGDSWNLLAAYLDREHEGWQPEQEQRAPHSGSSDLNEAQALDILGLKNGATKDDIVQAHRRMMQKVHPDRGGSTYLATKINAAKDFLIERF